MADSKSELDAKLEGVGETTENTATPGDSVALHEENDGPAILARVRALGEMLRGVVDTATRRDLYRIKRSDFEEEGPGAVELKYPFPEDLDRLPYSLFDDTSRPSTTRPRPLIGLGHRLQEDPADPWADWMKVFDSPKIIVPGGSSLADSIIPGNEGGEGGANDDPEDPTSK